MSSEQYLVLCLLSQLALELLELLRGVAAESLVGFLQSTNLSRNLVLFWLGKPARGRGNISGYCPNQLHRIVTSFQAQEKAKSTMSPFLSLPSSAKSCQDNQPAL